MSRDLNSLMEGELSDLKKLMDGKISELRAKLGSVEIENAKLTNENVVLRLIADQDRAAMEEKLRNANEQTKQHEKDVARLSSELEAARAEAREQKEKVKNMQNRLHKVVEDGSAFIRGLANQLNTTEEQLEKVKSEYNAIRRSVYGQAELQQQQQQQQQKPADRPRHVHRKPQKESSHHSHRHSKSPTIGDAYRQELLAKTIAEIADRHKFDDIVKPPSSIASRSSSADTGEDRPSKSADTSKADELIVDKLSISLAVAGIDTASADRSVSHKRVSRATSTNRSDRWRKATPPLKEIEFVPSKLNPKAPHKKHKKRRKQIKVERAGRAA